MGLELYGRIEDLLGFEEQKKRLYRIFLDRLLGLGVERVLDIGCGSGGFMELAKREGIDIRGIDLSHAMVHRATQRGLDCKSVDLCDLDERYQAAVAIFDVLNYIPPRRLAPFLECVKNVLEPKGYFLADINTYYGFEEVAQGALWIDRQDRFVAIEAEFDGLKLDTSLVYFERKDQCYTKSVDNITQYYHDVDQLKVSGLSIIDIDLISLFTQEVDKALIIFQKD